MKRILYFGFIAVLSVAAQAAPFLCPNGKYVSSGPCNLCPGGSYVGGGETCTIAPDGKYVGTKDASKPLALGPDGKWHDSGNKALLLCPDGSYVSGTRCELTPSGKYVGK